MPAGKRCCSYTLMACMVAAAAQQPPSEFAKASDTGVCELDLSSSGGSSWTACRVSDMHTASCAQPPCLGSAARLAAGQAMSLPGFNAPRGTSSSPCISARVPGTVLTSLALNGTFPEVPKEEDGLFFEDALASVPDIGADAGADFYTFAFRSNFSISQASFRRCGNQATERAWLHLKGISYRAEVFVNGMLLSPEEEGFGSEAVGMFHRFTYDLQPALGSLWQQPQPNNSTYDDASAVATIPIALAIIVRPVDHPGSAQHGGQGGDHEIARNAAASQFTAGWDWIQATPDRNTGIWDAVSVSATGPTRCFDPQIQVALAEDLQTAELQPSVWLSSGRGSDVLEGQLFFYLNGVLQSTTAVAAPPAAVPLQVHLPKLQLTQPMLWWPHTHAPNLATGAPYNASLYNASFQFVPASPSPSSLSSAVPSNHIFTTFGVRRVTTRYDAGTGGRIFTVNGVDVWLRGGNWIATDQFMRYADNRQRYRSEVRWHREMGLNLIRVWGGGITERDSFYEEADKQGMLVMQEFWMTGDNNGRWGGSYDFPDNHTVYLLNARDTVTRLRNHPSLLFYCGGNELYPSKRSPPVDIASALPAMIKELDAGRFYIPSSMSNWTDWDPDFALAPKDGPYGILDAVQLSKPNPGLIFSNGTVVGSSLKLGFQPETGSVSSPVYASLARFLSAEALQVFPAEHAGAAGSAPPPLFTYHNYIPFTSSDGLDHVYNYGSSIVNASEYSAAAQLAQNQQYKWLLEAFMSRMWQEYTAVIIWKTQSPWPVFRGAMYDSYLAPNGGLFGVKSALASQFQVVMIPSTLKLFLVNHSPSLALEAAEVQVSFYNYTSSLVHRVVINVAAVKPNAVLPLPGRLQWPAELSGASQVGLVRLTLTTPSTEHKGMGIVATNEYYLSEPSAAQNYRQVFSLLRDPANMVHLQVSCTRVASRDQEEEEQETVQVSLLHAGRKGSVVAFGVTLVLEFEQNGNKKANAVVSDRRVLPAFPSDSYFQLLAGESKTVDIDYYPNVLADVSPVSVRVEGWSVFPSLTSCV